MTTITKHGPPAARASRCRQRSNREAVATAKLRDLRIALLFILPAMIGLVAFCLVPTIRGIYLSFTEYSILGEPELDRRRQLHGDLQG